MKSLRDILTFRHMVTPVVVQWLFWIFVIITVIFNFRNMFGYGSTLFGLLGIVFGILAGRIFFELIIITFRMYDALIEIRDKLK